MSKRFLTLFFFFALLFFVNPAKLQAQVKYWVKFKDKAGSPFTLDNPGAFLTQKSVQRRQRHNVPLHVSDLPVPPAYIRGIDTLQNVNVIYVSKWLNGAVVSITNASVAPAALARIKSFAFVSDTSRAKKYKLNIDPVEESFPPEFLGKAQQQSAVTKSYPYGRAYGQLVQLKADCLHEKGLRGQGMTIAVMDAGFTNVNSGPAFDSIRNNGGILGGYDFVDGTSNPYVGSNHGTMVFSCLAGNKPNVIMGSAPMAWYWLFRTEEGGSETLVEEYNWIRAAEFADSVGVDIITTSLGYTEFDISSQNHNYNTLNGRTAPMSIAATMAARKGIFVLNSAGNDGGAPWKYVGVPADADSICSVGAVDTAGVYAGFSSQGPTADGRIKPDLVATGAGAMVCDQSNVCFKGANGTSFSCPILAGAVACFWQGNPQLNNIALLNEMKSRASNAKKPNNLIGWGIPKLCEFGYPRVNFPFSFTASYNTSQQLLTLKFTESVLDYATLEIFDLLGHKLFTTSLDVLSEKLSINVAIAASGVYLARITTPNGEVTKKFIK